MGDYRLFFVCTDVDTNEIRRVRHRGESYRYSLTVPTSRKEGEKWGGPSPATSYLIETNLSTNSE